MRPLKIHFTTHTAIQTSPYMKADNAAKRAAPCNQSSKPSPSLTGVSQISRHLGNVRLELDAPTPDMQAEYPFSFITADLLFSETIIQVGPMNVTSPPATIANLFQNPSLTWPFPAPACALRHSLTAYPMPLRLRPLRGCGRIL